LASVSLSGKYIIVSREKSDEIEINTPAQIRKRDKNLVKVYHLNGEAIKLAQYDGKDIEHLDKKLQKSSEDYKRIKKYLSEKYGIFI